MSKNKHKRAYYGKKNKKPIEKLELNIAKSERGNIYDRLDALESDSRDFKLTLSNWIKGDKKRWKFKLLVTAIATGLFLYGAINLETLIGIIFGVN